MAEPRYPKPEVAPTTRGRRAQIAHRGLRILCASVPLALGALVLWQQSQVRIVEAVVAQSLLARVMDGPVGQVNDIVTFPWTGGPIIGLKITEECTVAYLLGPMCLLVALLTVVTRSSLSRLAGGLFVGVGLLIVVNQIRVAIIAMSTQHWGLEGYDITHKLVGTAISLIGFTIAALAMIVVATGRRQVRGMRRAGA